MDPSKKSRPHKSHWTGRGIVSYALTRTPPSKRYAKDLVVRVRTLTVSTFKSVRTGVGTARITHAPPALARPYLNTIDIVVHNNQRNSGDGRKKEVLDHAADTS